MTADGIGVHRRLSRSVVSVAPDSAARMLNSADCIWRAVSYRSSGTLLRAFPTTRSRAAGIDGAMVRSGFGSVVSTWYSTPWTVSPSNGLRYASSSYSRQPTAKMSVAGVIAPFVICSGAM